MKNKNKYYIALSIVAMIISSVFAGSTFFVIKDLVQNVDPVLITAYRFLGAGGLLYIACLSLKKDIFTDIKPGIILGNLLFLFFIGQNVGLLYTSASQMSFLTGLFVIIVPFVVWLVEQKRIKTFDLVIAAICTYGLWVLSGGISEFGIGYVLGLFAGLVYAVYVVMGDKFIRKDNRDILVLTTHQFITLGLLSLVWVILTTNDFSYESNSDLQNIAYLIIFPSLGSFGIINIAQRYLPAFAMSLLLTLTTVMGAVLAWTIGGETATSEEIFGGVIIILAILMPIARQGLDKYIKKGNT